MRIVVDTNILFSSLLPNSSHFRSILFDNRYSFYMPNFIIVEIFKHKEKILSYSKSSDEEIYEYLNSIFQRVHFINNEAVSKENREMAFELCKTIDEKDTPFVALTLELDAFLWTGDAKLKTGLKKKNFGKFIQF